jgi:hypothetical protein
MLSAEKKFSSLEEEVEFLRERARVREAGMERGGPDATKEAIRQTIREYREAPVENVLSPAYKITPTEISKVALDLTPEKHDQTINQLAVILARKGIKNALAVVSHLKNPHLDDDFERFLVEYLKEGFPLSGFSKRSPIFRALQMTLYEITLPEQVAAADRQKTLKEMISSMEQFYAGMQSVRGVKTAGPDYFTIELAVANDSEEFVFYAAVPDARRELFEKQILSFFPNARLTIKKDDYNIFNEAGAAAASRAILQIHPIFPIKQYDEFDHDPLSVLLNSFSKIDRNGEGAAIQIIIYPAADNGYNLRYQRMLDKIKKGATVQEALALPESIGGHLWQFAKEVIQEIFGTAERKEKNSTPPAKELTSPDEAVIQEINKKIASPIIKTVIRLVASAASPMEATAILTDMESAFHQFENPKGNKFRFTRLTGRKLRVFLRNFSYRLFDDRESLPLSIRELTTIFHFPTVSVASPPQVKLSKSKNAAPPPGLPTEGVLLGLNRDRNLETKIYLSREDRLRHFYVIGQTGTGKTTLLKNLIAQDIRNGEGVCFIDPHGGDLQDVLALIPPSRFEDVIYFDPGYVSRPMALNMLEYDHRFPEQKTFVVNELFSIFQKLYGAVPESMGPMFEQYFRNATLLVIDDPLSGSTLFEISRVLANKEFRDFKLSRCRNPVVVQFWREVAEKAGGEAALANIVPYITSKFDVFLANDIMRPIVAQEKSSWNFREIMDNRKIMLVNLSKGRLGEINSNLIGLIIVGKILMAALSRADTLGSGRELPPFYLYIDEFQNVTTPSITTILSEARKYRLSLNVAHQFIKQLDEKIRDAVFGNVGSICAFRVGAEDGEFLAKQFEPVFSAFDLINLENRHACVRMLSLGLPARPFSLETLPSPDGDESQIDKLKELSYLKYGRDRREVEEEISGKYRTLSGTS